MNPLRPWRGLSVVTLFATVVAAQEATSPAFVPAAPPPAAPALPAERAVSPHVAELLAAAMPKSRPIPQFPPTPEKLGPVAPVALDVEKPANGIVRLPRVVVSETKVPGRLEILTEKELERYAMERYIGPKDGLDRGFLNLFTIAGLWKKIPVLGHIPFAGSETNEDRAMRLYDTAERKRKMDELMGLMRMTKEVEEVPDSKKNETGDQRDHDPGPSRGERSLAAKVGLAGLIRWAEASVARLWLLRIGFLLAKVGGFRRYTRAPAVRASEWRANPIHVVSLTQRRHHSPRSAPAPDRAHLRRGHQAPTRTAGARGLA